MEFWKGKSLVALFNGKSTVVGHLMPKPSFEEKTYDTIQPIAEGYHYHVVLRARISLTRSLSLSLSILLYHPSLPTGLLDYILCPNRAVVDRFQLVVKLLHVRVKGSIGERCLWVRSYFSSNVPHVLSYLDGFRDGKYVAVQLQLRGMLLPGFVNYGL